MKVHVYRTASPNNILLEEPARFGRSIKLPCAATACSVGGEVPEYAEAVGHGMYRVRLGVTEAHAVLARPKCAPCGTKVVKTKLDGVKNCRISG